MLMPKPSQDVIDRRAGIVNALRAIVPGDGVITAAEKMRAHKTDGLSAYRQVPVMPTVELLDWATGGPRPAALEPSSIAAE